MKISDIVRKDYHDIMEMERFDLDQYPIRPKWYLQLLAFALALPETFTTKSTIKKINMDGIKSPYLLLCNHNSFYDFKIATKAIFPRRSNYIVAVDGFIGRESLMRNVGCFMKRKFVSDVRTAKHTMHSLKNNKVICQIYPEARYSLVGTNSMLPPSLGKLVKWLKSDVVTLISHGHHLKQPFFNLKQRKVETYTELKCIIKKEELESLSIEEINQILKESFEYNDYKYQLENNIQINEPFRAEGLHKPLYKCPHCLDEESMSSKGTQLTCKKCGVTYELTPLGELRNINGESKFTHVPDWFEWERQMVKEEIENNQYYSEIEVEIDILQNSTGFYRVGKGTLSHNKTGYHLKHKDFEVYKPAKNDFGVHIEYDYFGKGDCISFSTKNDTYYIYPIDQKHSVTKYHFATEELYKKSNIL